MPAAKPDIEERRCRVCRQVDWRCQCSLEVRQAALREHQYATDEGRIRRNLQRRTRRQKNNDAVNEKDRAYRIALRIRKRVLEIVPILEQAIQCGKFREPSLLEKVRIRAKEQARANTPMSIEDAADLFNVNVRTFLAYFVYPGRYGNLRCVSENGAPRFFKTSDVEALWERYFEARPHLLHRRRYGSGSDDETTAGKPARLPRRKKRIR